MGIQVLFSRFAVMVVLFPRISLRSVADCMDTKSRVKVPLGVLVFNNNALFLSRHVISVTSDLRQHQNRHKSRETTYNLENFLGQERKGLRM